MTWAKSAMSVSSLDSLTTTVELLTPTEVQESPISHESIDSLLEKVQRSPSPSTEVSYVTGHTPTPDADDENDEPEAEPNESRPHAQVSKHSLVSHWSKALSFGKAFNDVIYAVQQSCYQAKIVTDYVCCLNLQNYQSCFEPEQIRVTIADPGLKF